ncbi:MAG: winged helix-turn-helix domain-containing protein [Candidatus Hodarchaeales archaeon]
MADMEDTARGNDRAIRAEKVITEPATVPVLFHEKKQSILKLLIDTEMTIIDLKKATNLNPGTIKRHLTDLVSKGLVRQSNIKINKFGVKMKFYRATARQFTINLSWP